MVYIFNAFTIIFAAQNISVIKIKKRYLYIHTILVSLIMQLITNYYEAKIGEVPLILRFAFGLLFIAFISYVLYKHVGKIFACISYSILAMILSIIADNITLAVFIKLKLVKMTDLVFNTQYAFAFSVSELILAYILSYVLGKLIAKYSYLQLFNNYNKYTVSIMVIFISTFILVFYYNMFGNLNIFDHYLTLAFLLIYLAFVSIISFISFKSFAREEKAKQQKIELQQLNEYTTNLESLYNDMRKFKHDYVNVLSSMISYLDDNDINGLKEYFNTNIIPFSNQIKSDSFKLGLLSNLKIRELKGIISSKLIYAQQQGIDVFIDIVESIERIDLNIIELCRIIGILTDNAIEAALVSKEPSVKIAIVKRRASVVIVIENSCSEEVPHVYKIFEEGFSTKGDNRGLGLFTVKQIIDNLENCFLDTVIRQPMFTQILEINNVAH